MTENDTNIPREYAAVDLGSNSFHMVVSRRDESNLIVVDRLREMVRLGSGFDDQNRLSEIACERALGCLTRFGERLRGMNTDNVRVVGTNSLRLAKNALQFIRQAEEELGFPVDVISGVEEARLIYLGVSETLQEDLGRRLVIDIGGGSTEMIVGDSAMPLYLESLYMGCVSTSELFFADGKISKSRMDKAIMAACVVLEPHIAIFENLNWEDIIATSGTARSIEEVSREAGWTEGGITRESMEKLVGAILQADHVDELKLAGLSDTRRSVFPGGVAILMAIFKSLSINHMRISEGSIREGVLADLIDRRQSLDTRAETVTAMISRHRIDEAQANRVCETALVIFSQLKKVWKFNSRDRELLSRAALLHEIGLMIAHGQYHKHGAYVLEYMELAGFSRQEQRELSLLVRLHRKKFHNEVLSGLDEDRTLVLSRLIFVLRLAVVFNRGRRPEDLPKIKISAVDADISLKLDSQWLADHPLTQADLEQEQHYLRSSIFSLKVKEMAA